MGEKNTKICHPLLGLPWQPNPPIIKHALSRSIMNRFLQNFRFSFFENKLRYDIKMTFWQIFQIFRKS